MVDNGCGWNDQDYASTKMNFGAIGINSISFKIRFGVRQECALSTTLFNKITDWILSQALQDYTGVQLGANVHMSNFAYADDIAVATERCKASLKLLTAMPQQPACTLTSRRPR